MNRFLFVAVLATVSLAATEHAPSTDQHTAAEHVAVNEKRFGGGHAGSCPPACGWGDRSGDKEDVRDDEHAPPVEEHVAVNDKRFGGGHAGSCPPACGWGDRSGDKEQARDGETATSDKIDGPNDESHQTVAQRREGEFGGGHAGSCPPACGWGDRSGDKEQA